MSLRHRRRRGRRVRPAVLAVPVALAIAVVLGVASPAVAARDDEAAIREAAAAVALLDELDRRTVSVAWDQQPLLRIVNELDVVHGIPVTADWTSLERLGVRPRTELTLRAEDASALSVLRQLAVLVGDEFERARIESWGGRILLTTEAIAGSILLPAVHDVRDLLALEGRRRDPAGIPTGGLPTPATGTGGGGGPGGAGDDATGDQDHGGGRPGADADAGAGAGAGDGDGSTAPGSELAPTVAGPGARLVLMALEHADPGAWVRFGGETARVTERDGVLLVTASATTHRLLRTVLEELRRVDPRGLVLEASIVRIPSGLWERLDRRYDPSRSAFARRLLAAEDARVLWRSRTPVAVGGTLRIEEHVAGAGTVRLSLAPVRDPAIGGVRLAVDLAWTSQSDAGAAGDGDGSGELRTEVPLASVGGAASIGIPGGRGGRADAADGDELVLVVLPRRY